MLFVMKTERSIGQKGNLGQTVVHVAEMIEKNLMLPYLDIMKTHLAFLSCTKYHV